MSSILRSERYQTALRLEKEIIDEAALRRLLQSIAAGTAR